MLTPSLLVTVALTAAATPAPQDDLELAGQWLADLDEGQVRRGSHRAAEVDSPAAVELLLGVLGEWSGRGNGALPPPHYRDVAWEGLERIQDPYARQRVEEELKRNKDDAFVRQWCAELLGIYGEPRFSGTLQKALKDKDLGVRRAAARSLGQIGEPGAIVALHKVARHKDPILRANAIEALARLDLEGEQERLDKAIEKDKDGGVRCALLGAATELVAPLDLELYCVRALAEDDDWRVRVQAVESLGTLRTKSAVDVLLMMFADERPVVGERAIRALQELTGQKHRRPEAWDAWWADNRETFDFPEGRAQAAPNEDRSVATYNGIRLVSDNVAFLLDRSHAMGERLTSRELSKAAASELELEAVLTKLEGDLRFNVFTYEARVEALDDKAVELKKSTRKKALAFVADHALQGAKDIWQALEAVLDDPTIDTAYLLSSGEPDIGLYVHSNRIVPHLRDRNRFRKLTVHTIAYSEEEFFRDQLRRIAEATGGEFQAYE